jgi:hypothetical protein
MTLCDITTAVFAWVFLFSFGVVGGKLIFDKWRRNK